MTEHQIQQEILAKHGAIGQRLWRNNTGVLLDRSGRPVRFGLCPGSSDIIGFRQVEIGGYRLAQFVALEVKGPKGRVTSQQQQFLDVIQRFGGVSGVVRSVDDAVSLLRQPL